MNRRPLILITTLYAAVRADAGVMIKEPQSHELPISVSGSFWIDNPVGSIEISGRDGERALVTATKTVYAADRSTLDDAREQCTVSLEGDEKVRLVRTLVTQIPNAHCSITYAVQLPRSVDLKIGAKAGDVRVTGMSGSVTVKNFTGTVFLSGVYGASAIDLVNGHIVYDFPRAPSAKAQATIINGDIDIYVPAEANFEWVASTLAGDLMTTMPVRGNLVSGMFHGHFNAPGGPTITASSILGRVRVLARGTTPAQSRSIAIPGGERVTPPSSPQSGPPMQKFQMPIIMGTFMFAFPDRIVDLSVGEVRGSAKVETAAGEVELGVVQGNCDVDTGGGPLNIGEVSGGLQAHTGAGDILVRAARLGGDITSGGGNITVLYTGGPTTLRSSGGDIVVRQAAGPTSAVTPSGDITLTVAPTARSLRLSARTEKGNVSVNVTRHFAADVDATVITSNPDANAIHSDFSTLTVRREQIGGGRTRIHATGKINGGGERLELYAENGDITINSQTTAPLSVISPNQ